MIRTGIFRVVNGESLLSDGTLLAVCSAPSPLVAARPFLLGRQCQVGQLVQVSGDFSQIGQVTVFCMSDARPATSAMVENVVAGTRLAKSPKKSIGKKRKTKQKRSFKKTSRSKARRSKTKARKGTRRKSSK